MDDDSSDQFPIGMRVLVIDHDPTSLLLLETLIRTLLSVYVMNAISHGACDFLVKPVRLEGLKNIWQHVIRKKKKKSEDQFVWSVELHRKFVAAVNQLGIDKDVPKKILDLMNVENITREDVASHLQKYRLYSRMSGFGHFRNNALRSFSPSGIIGNRNTPTGPNEHEFLLPDYFSWDNHII